MAWAGNALLSNVGSHILVRLVDVHKLLQRPTRLAEISVHFDVASGGRTKGDETGGDALDDVQVVLEVDNDVLRARVKDVVEHCQSLQHDPNKSRRGSVKGSRRSKGA